MRCERNKTSKNEVLREKNWSDDVQFFFSARIYFFHNVTQNEMNCFIRKVGIYEWDPFNISRPKTIKIEKQEL
jgi:hypothetical protein